MEYRGQETRPAAAQDVIPSVGTPPARTLSHDPTYWTRVAAAEPSGAVQRRYDRLGIRTVTTHAIRGLSAVAAQQLCTASKNSCPPLR